MPPKPKTKTRAQILEEFRTTRPCRDCGMKLVTSTDTLGHTPAVCNAYKAKMAKEAAIKAKKAASKPVKK